VRGPSRLAVLAGPESSLTPAEIARSADGFVDLWFLLDAADSGVPGQALHMVASALAPTAVVDFTDFGACRDAVRAAGAMAVTTFSDRYCPLAARLSAEIKGASVAWPAWGRKDVQRRMLRAAGVSKVESAEIGGRGSLRSFVRAVGLPVVVKPTGGAASRDTWLLATESDISEFLRLSGDGGARTGMFAERFIVGEPPVAAHLADYVSAEVFRFAAAGQASENLFSHAFVTDRLVPAWPCRETGLVLPSAMAPDRQESVIAVARKALDALSADVGAFHVEVKPGRPAPEVIEVNGRLGGFIARLVRYGTGQDIGRLALSCALGQYADLDLRWDRCVLVLLFQAPARADRIERAPSRREVARRPGVQAVDMVSPAGASVNWRGGTNLAPAWVWLAADSHAELRGHLLDLAAFLSEEFSFVDAAGNPIRDHGWIERITRGESGGLE